MTTLARYHVYLRCTGCGQEFPPSSRVEEFKSYAGKWIVVTCPECKRCTPHQLTDLEVIQ